MCCIGWCQHTAVYTYAKDHVLSFGEVPVYKLVLLQILAALSNVSGHIKKVYHGQAGWLILIRKEQTICEKVCGRFGKTD